MTSPPSHSPELRQRAAHLIRLAAQIERAVAVLTPDLAAGADRQRAALCHRLLETNLHQLHRAADDLRSTAFQFRCRADELDTATWAA